MNNILEVVNLKKQFTDWSNYKESFCLNNISFSVPKGYIMGFIGPNGSVKSTTIKLIMDEPTSGLDPVFRREILDILLELMQNENKSVFFSTHITTDLEKIADYITYINKGNIVFSKSKEEILDNYAIVKGDKNILNKDLKEKFIGIKENAFGFEALTDNVNQIQNLFADSILIDKASLDDIMVFTSKNS